MKLRDGVDIDNTMCAEIPDCHNDPDLFGVMPSMVHGPCGILNPSSVCIVDGTCSKSYPKEFVYVQSYQMTYILYTGDGTMDAQSK